jgi:KDO2-lipid IV(A) lauroyltransferase
MQISRNVIDRIANFLVQGFFCTANMMPPFIGLPMGRIIGYLVCLLDGHHRNIARANIKFAFQGTKSGPEINRLVYQSFMQWGMNAYEWGKERFFHRNPPDHAPIQMVVKGRAHLQAARNRNQGGVLILSAHFGNWEYGHLHYAATINKLNFIVRRIDNPLIEKNRVVANDHFGVTILYKKKGLKTAIKSLKKGEDLVIFADQKANPKEGVKCRFFGRETMTLPIVAALAKKYQFPIVPMFVVRKGNGPVHEMVFLPELIYSQSDTIEQISQRQNDIIEGIIRKHPDHWLWMHRKWKTEYPEIYRKSPEIYRKR